MQFKKRLPRNVKQRLKLLEANSFSLWQNQSTDHAKNGNDAKKKDRFDIKMYDEEKGKKEKKKRKKVMILMKYHLTKTAKIKNNIAL